VTTVQLVVTSLGVVAIAWVNYWFFFSKSVKGERRER
jgi:plastocyanin domain-containing protein